jgi:hypothetical protein
MFTDPEAQRHIAIAILEGKFGTEENTLIKFAQKIRDPEALETLVAAVRAGQFKSEDYPSFISALADALPPIQGVALLYRTNLFSEETFKDMISSFRHKSQKEVEFARDFDRFIAIFKGQDLPAALKIIASQLRRFDNSETRPLMERHIGRFHVVPGFPFQDTPKYAKDAFAMWHTKRAKELADATRIAKEQEVADIKRAKEKEAADIKRAKEEEDQLVKEWYARMSENPYELIKAEKKTRGERAQEQKLWNQKRVSAQIAREQAWAEQARRQREYDLERFRLDNAEALGLDRWTETQTQERKQNARQIQEWMQAYQKEQLAREEK